MTSESPDDADAMDARHPHAVRMAELGVVIDRIGEADRELATIAACRAELIEQARQLSLADVAATTAESGRAPGDTGIGWTVSTVAHRELISEIACALRIPERTASTLVEHSRALVQELPTTLTALSTGEISYRHAQALIDHAATVPTDATATFEAAVLPHAKQLTVTKFDRKARILREHSHPDSITQRTHTARDNRNIGWEPARDGMAWLNAYLPAEIAIASYHRIDDIANGLHHRDEPRTITQLRADVLTDLLIDGTTDREPERTTAGPITEADFDVLVAMQFGIAEHTGINVTLDSITAGVEAHRTTTDGTTDNTGTATTRTRASHDSIGRGIRARVLVTVPVLTLLGNDDGPGSLEGYGPIDADTAKSLAAGAPSFIRLLTHPETGTVLSVGRDHYAVPADLKLWLRIRDETCRHPGCNTSAGRCEIDHSLDWQYDGLTKHDNLSHLCPKHHHLKHHTGWTVEQRDDGVLDWTSPTGHEYRTQPPQTLRTPTFR